jgi:thiol-disulfide isomerase/thioredoxin
MYHLDIIVRSLTGLPLFRAASTTLWVAVLMSLLATGNVTANDASNTHALLINGGGKPRINYQSHLLHIERIYGLLTEAGIPEAQISILSADGSSPEPDLATRAIQGESEFWLLAGTRLERALRPRIQYENSEIEAAWLQAATRDNLRSWFEDAAVSLGKCDTLLLYVTDHGTPNKEDSNNNQITLWGEDEAIDVEELRALVNLLQPSVRVVALMSQCFSGSFANLIFERDGDTLPRPNMSGFFSTTADRPAYGCYPENRDKDHVGHSFRFFDALERGGALSEAHKQVLITDRTPDVPLKASDFYLESLIVARAEALGIPVDDFADQLLKEAWQRKAEWEPEIRLLDRLGEGFGYFSPRYLAELAQHSEILAATGKRLADYETAWKRARQSLNRETLDRFLESHPDWDARLSKEALQTLFERERAELTGELLPELSAFVENDADTADRLRLLHEKAEATDAASYRTEVREGVVLRMRSILYSIAGREYLSRDGSTAQREAYANLTGHEAFALKDAVENLDSVADIEPFPSFADELKLAEAALPGWMGIQFRALSAERRSEHGLGIGAVSVLAVYPDSPAAEAGLAAGDIIVGRPDQPFTERDYVREWVMTAPIGEAQPLQVRRGDEMLTLALTPGPFPAEWPSLPGPPEVGSPAPAIDTLESFRGKPVAELSGQGPYLMFFWATWCGPCKAAVPELLAFEQERGIPVLSITDESSNDVAGFLQKRQEPFPETIALDETRRSFLAYGVAGTPRFVLIDGAGNIQSYSTGYRASKGLEIDGWAWRKETPAGE